MLKRLFSNHRELDDIIVVSGLPRSGTSMMMQMLEVGGINPLADGVRSTDESNPRGYYEFERVKKLPAGDDGWLKDAQGKAVKVISALLPALPEVYNYRVIFMQRHLDEVLASQQAMIEAQTPNHHFDYGTSRKDTLQHLESIQRWLASQSYLQTLYVDYREMIEEPEPAFDRIEAFLEKKLAKAQMRTVIDPQLYHQRRRQ